MSQSLTREEVQELVRQIKAVPIYYRDMLEKIDTLTDQIKAGGWKLKVEAYSALSFHQRNRLRSSLRQLLEKQEIEESHQEDK